jgi:protein-disulfide isomerase
MTRSWAAALLFLAVSALLGFACGGDDDDGAPATATTAAASTTRTAPRSVTAAATAEVSALRTPPAAALWDGFGLGSREAKVTVAVYEDFQCPFCLRYTLGLEKTLIREYVATGRVRLEFKNFPILGPESVEAAIAAACMADQGKFWPHHHRLYLEQGLAGQLEDERLNAGRFSPENLTAWAVESGADRAAFTACFDSEASFTKLQAAVREAQGLGVRSTPTWVVGSTVLSGGPRDAAAMRKLLDDALAAAK